MKKFIILLVITLSLSACLKDKKETALENCADGTFLKKNPYSLNFKSSVIAKSIKNNKEFKTAVNNLQKATKKQEQSETNVYEYAKINFGLADDEISKILKSSFVDSKMGFSDEVLALLGADLDPEEVDQMISSGTKEQKKEFKDLITKLNEANNNYGLYMDWRGEITTYLFLKSKVKDKFTNEKYQKYYEKCEGDHRKLPSSFMAKWEESNQVKDFYEKKKPSN